MGGVVQVALFQRRGALLEHAVRLRPFETQRSFEPPHSQIKGPVCAVCVCVGGGSPRPSAVAAARPQ